MKNDVLDLIRKAGMTYESFRRLFAEQIENPDLNNELEKKHFENRKLNWYRTQRLEKTFNLSQGLIDAVLKIAEPQLWIVITESWCGDSAQVLPIIFKAVSLNNKITLKIITRDDNPAIIDCYLTNGSRSIPKLISFDKIGVETFQWGPRPKPATELMRDLKSEGIAGPELYERLHLWYGRNRGAAFEKELIELINGAVSEPVMI